MKKHICALVGWLALTTMLSACNHQANSEKTVVQVDALYPKQTIESLAQEAETIVCGQVTGIGEAYLERVYLADGSGDYVEDPYTPITITVEDCLKGDSSLETVVYNQSGGEFADVVYKTNDGAEVETGDNILIFLSADGYTWGGQSVYFIEDGMTTIRNDMLPTAVLSDESESQTSEISLAELEELVLTYVNE